MLSQIFTRKYSGDSHNVSGCYRKSFCSFLPPFLSVCLSVIYNRKKYQTKYNINTILYVQKSWPILYSKLPNKMNQDFLDIQYTQGNKIWKKSYVSQYWQIQEILMNDLRRGGLSMLWALMNYEFGNKILILPNDAFLKCWLYKRDFMISICIICF